MQSRLIRLIKVVFSKGWLIDEARFNVPPNTYSKGTMLSVSNKSKAINECTSTDEQKNNIPYSRGSPEVPMN